MLSHLLIDKVILSTTHKSSYTGPFYPAAMLNGIHIRRELFDWCMIIMYKRDDDEMVRESDITQCQPSLRVEFTCRMIIIANSIFGKFVIVFENWREN